MNNKSLLTVLCVLISCVCFSLVSCVSSQRSGQSLTHVERDKLASLSQMPVLCTLQVMDEVLSRLDSKYVPSTPQEALLLAALCAPECKTPVYAVQTYLEELNMNSHFTKGYIDDLVESYPRDAAYIYLKQAAF